MSELSRMLAGELYKASDPELTAYRKRAHRLCRLFNNAGEEDERYRAGLLKDLFGDFSSNSHLEPDFKCDYGFNIKLGQNFYANFDCLILDICPVTIGDNVMFGPRVCIYTAGHPLDVETRNQQLEFGKPVTIGDNVWIGGGAIILPGVSIGNNTVIGAGAVVAKDIPAGVLAAGNPCRTLRNLSGADQEYWGRLQIEYVASVATESAARPPFK